jgi:phosphoglycolate phosphatase-like HAD superfamily hydrolase
MKEVNLLNSIKIFWDIDGTLLKTNGAAAIAFAESVSEFAGAEVIIDRKKLSGLTDYEIVFSLLKSFNIHVGVKEADAILELYAEKLPSALSKGKVEKINNVENVLMGLSEIPQIELAIGTGNFSLGARIKLDHVNLIKYFSDKNFFCASTSYWTRNSVIQNAKNSIARRQTGIVIGDSPQDILSAKHVGMKIISVPTGAHSQGELERLMPDLALSADWNYEDLITGISQLI